MLWVANHDTSSPALIADGLVCMRASQPILGAVALAVASAAVGWWAARHLGGADEAHVASTRNTALQPDRNGAEGRHVAADTSDSRVPVRLRVTAVLLQHGQGIGAGPGSQAMISVNGGATRPFALGARVHQDLFLRTIAADRVRIANDGGTVVFDLSVDTTASTSTAEVTRSGPGVSEVREQEAVARSMTFGPASPEISTSQAQTEAQPRLATELAGPAGRSSEAPAVVLGAGDGPLGQIALQLSATRSEFESAEGRATSTASGHPSQLGQQPWMATAGPAAPPEVSE